MVSKTIVLAGDYGYINQVTTTIKSVLYNNRDIKFYLLNNDIPQDWFIQVNRRLKSLNSFIVDRKLNLEEFGELANTRGYINSLTYGRLLIPRLIPEERVLYLDSDIIVDDDLTPLFELDLEGHSIAAVEDIIGDSFNAGVLVINNNKLRQDPDIVQKMLDFGREHDLINADQDILNHFFSNDRLKLPLQYNYPIGSDSVAFYNPNIVPNFESKMAAVQHPVIVHYSSGDKPWNFASGGRMREKWWQYANLNWYDLIMRNQMPKTERQPKSSFFTFTATDQLVHIIELAKALPECDFNIAAWTTMSSSLLNLSHFHNVHLYPTIAGPLIDELVNKSSAYLDINREGKEEQFMDRFLNNNLPVFAFRSVMDDKYKDNDHYHVFNDDDYQNMIDQLRQATAATDNQ